jgi:hypothetical protein
MQNPKSPLKIQTTGAKLRTDFLNALSRPWLTFLIAIALFVALQSNLGRNKENSTDELTLPESISIAKQRHPKSNLTEALKMDHFLQQNGWVEEIAH